ncbi:MAG: hypothetical protein OSB43_18145 [Nocardioides sp.]|uniref:hypothetical protein n=1 Tax=Nocardioides sp. TaxID=35761 RepID=UPI00238EFC3E|nr:hypothetical protein [Nocardioides sp.]MDE0778206.1 hypothetical protein [Nocardioides sp.]
MTHLPAHPGEVRDLLARLAALEVDLPEELTAAGSQLQRIHHLAPRTVLPSTLIGLDDDAVVAVVRDLAVATAMKTLSSGVVNDVAGVLAADIADGIRDQADEILDQLRPRFDNEAAKAHAAAELGLQPSTTAMDILRSDNVEALRDAWAALPSAARTLDALAEARMKLSTAAGAAPTTTRSSLNAIAPVRDVANYAFHASARPWTVKGEDAWQRWLRLCTGTPARLLTIEESAQTASAAKNAEIAKRVAR